MFLFYYLWHFRRIRPFTLHRKWRNCCTTTSRSFLGNNAQKWFFTDLDQDKNTQGTHEHNKFWGVFSAHWVLLWKASLSLIHIYSQELLKKVILRRFRNSQIFLKCFTVTWPGSWRIIQVILKNYFQKRKYGTSYF